MTIERMVPLAVLQSIGPAGRMATDAATHPEAAQAQSRVLLEALLKEQAGQVQSVENTAASGVIDEDAQSGAKDGSSKQSAKRDLDDDENDSEETMPSTEGPFLGNVLNRKV